MQLGWCRDSRPRPLDAKLAQENGEVTVELSRAKGELENQLSETNSELASARSEIRTRDLRSSAVWRLLLVGVAWLAAEAALGYAATQLGDGENTFQKLKNAWELLAFPLPCAVGLTWFDLGRDRIRAMGWPFGKLLSGSEDE